MIHQRLLAVPQRHRQSPRQRNADVTGFSARKIQDLRTEPVTMWLQLRLIKFVGALGGVVSEMLGGVGVGGIGVGVGGLPKL